MKLFIKFVSLPAFERRLLLRAAFLVSGIRLGLSAFSFRTVSRIVAQRSARNSKAHTFDDNLVKRITWSVGIAARYVPAATCLTQALSAMSLLSEFGQPAFLRIGVAKSSEGKLEAHAWVESGGEIVIGNLSDLSRYRVLSPIDKEYRHERHLRHI